MLSSEFLQKTHELYRPRMGTEAVAPLLYSLIRTTRPQRVFEIGMGYTTPFILKALADNVADVEAERLALGQGGAVSDENPIEFPFMHRDYYSEIKYAPFLHAVDNFSNDNCAAPLVMDLVEELGLAAYLRVHNTDFRGCSDRFTDDDLPIDFAWIDNGGFNNLQTIFEEYWPLINKNGGMCLVHSTLSNFESNAFLQRLKMRQATSEFNDFEVISLLEPHKTSQNSLSIIRMTSEYKDQIFAARP